jgi:hypothetical protein
MPKVSDPNFNEDRKRRKRRRSKQTNNSKIKDNHDRGYLWALMHDSHDKNFVYSYCAKCGTKFRRPIKAFGTLDCSELQLVRNQPTISKRVCAMNGDKTIHTCLWQKTFGLLYLAELRDKQDK